MSKYLKNLTVYSEGGVIEKGSILLDGEKISKIFKEGDAGVQADEIIDGKGAIAIPGYIDTHVHGGNGYDVGNGTIEAIYGMRDYYQQHGVTMIYPTFMTNELSIIENGLKALREAVKTNAPGKAEIAGSHIEGPFLNPMYKGCQAEYLIIPLDDKNIRLFEDYRDVIARATIAPEYKNNLSYFPGLAKLGIQLSVGHSYATISQVAEAAEKGATSITHLYNAQSQTRKEGPYRIGGVVEAGLTIDSLYTEAICDGYHLPNELVRIAYRCKGPKKMLIVSDASLCSGMASGTVVRTSGVDFYVEDGIAMNEARTSFASSTSPIDKMVRHLIFDTKLPAADVVEMASATPARLMGIFDRKGSIAEGKDADINIVDKDFNVLRTICKGI
ncbi:MAG: N-acetylglucosamine-6-phosphate deacetylase [Bacteroidales bacterium]|nr:N-acetylglucosamine-6-phosphate deacetylase [Candidatus Cacconaster merdequi]